MVFFQSAAEYTRISLHEVWLPYPLDLNAMPCCCAITGIEHALLHMQVPLHKHLCNSKRLCRNSDTTAIQSSHRTEPSLSFFSQKIFFRNFYIVKNKFRCGRRTNLKFIVMVSEGKSFPSFFSNNKCTDSLVPIPGVVTAKKQHKYPLSVHL